MMSTPWVRGAGRAVPRSRCALAADTPRGHHHPACYGVDSMATLLLLIASSVVATAGGCGTHSVTQMVERAQRAAAAAAVWQQCVGHHQTGVMPLSVEHRGASLTVEEAQTLARNSHSIFLRNVVAIDAPSAQILAATSASLHFERLSVLSPAVAQALASHRCLLQA